MTDEEQFEQWNRGPGFAVWEARDDVSGMTALFQDRDDAVEYAKNMSWRQMGVWRVMARYVSPSTVSLMEVTC